MHNIFTENIKYREEDQKCFSAVSGSTWFICARKNSNMLLAVGVTRQS
jgi:hypothetical protein